VRDEETEERVTMAAVGGVVEMVVVVVGVVEA
jgi:hypothetical protein